MDLPILNLLELDIGWYAWIKFILILMDFQSQKHLRKLNIRRNGNCLFYSEDKIPGQDNYCACFCLNIFHLVKKIVFETGVLQLRYHNYWPLEKWKVRIIWDSSVQQV